MKIGLYFGTFNPIHVGHLIIANHMADYTELEQVWLVVSPQNPHKTKQSMLDDYHRLALTRVAVENNRSLRASNIEFDLPRPSYTVNTLAQIQEKYPEHDFSLIMGEDNLRTFHKWKNHEEILANHDIYVYPRLVVQGEPVSESKNDFAQHPRVKMVDAPLMKISASFIRDAIRNKKDVRYLLTDAVFKYVQEMHFYEK